MLNAHVGADSTAEWPGDLHWAVHEDVLRYAVIADHLLDTHMFHLWREDFISAGQVDGHLR